MPDRRFASCEPRGMSAIHYEHGYMTRGRRETFPDIPNTDFPGGADSKKWAKHLKAHSIILLHTCFRPLGNLPDV